MKYIILTCLALPEDRGGKYKLGMTLKEFTRQFDAARIRTSVDSQGHHTKITGKKSQSQLFGHFRHFPEN